MLTRYTVLQSIASFREYALAQPFVGVAYPAKVHSGVIEYRGGEVPAFDMYLRMNHEKGVLASISAQSEGKGRMPVVMAALETLCGKVIVENVLNPHLEGFLLRRGYNVLDPEETPLSYVWTKG